MIPVAKTPTFPVIETFGPTVQGEGILAGVPTYFVRFGLCDYRCVWCDSKYAVEPSEVKANATRQTAREIADDILNLNSGPRWITLSGGNPAMHPLGDLTGLLHDLGYLVAVETQGSLWRSWLSDVECLTVSPKPPSSGMADKVEKDLPAFMQQALLGRQDVRPDKRLDAIKIVVFNDDDFAWARDTFEQYEGMGFAPFISCGTDTVSAWGTDVVAAESHSFAVRKIGERYAMLCDKVAADHALCRLGVKVLPQLHVIAYGHARGV